MSSRDRGVKLVPEGLALGDQIVPLYAGCVHYWRLEPQHWASCLKALRELGLCLVDIYVPWSVHETAPGQFEFGQRDPQRDVVAFLRLAQELGLWAIVRPGPHINAELTFFGIPERVIWDAECQARSPRGNPVLLPCPPQAFPVPSYASEAYAEQVEIFFERLGPLLGPLLYPDGPIVLLQIDNEGALYFRDAVYDQDYHPDAVTKFRAFMNTRYETDDALREAYGESVAGRSQADEALSLVSVSPPIRFDADSAQCLPPHLDWAHFQETLIADGLKRFSNGLAQAGLSGIPTMHNFPVAEHTTPLNAQLICQAVDMVGLDYYGRAGPQARRDISRRTGQLAVQCAAASHPPYSCEMGAGFPPFFPPLSEQDSAFTVLAALAYGLRGFNIYMAVERDRWIGAPIDCRGRPRRFARFWRRLLAALQETDFHQLRRHLPVRLVLPRTEQRLARVMHAFGPASGAMLAVMGFGPRECCFEQDLGLGYHPVLEVEAFIRRFERALEAQGVPFALVGAGGSDRALNDARWVICACSGALDEQLSRQLTTLSKTGTRVTLGPQRPRWDGAWARRLSPEAERVWTASELLDTTDPAMIDAMVSRTVEQLDLPRYRCEPVGLFVTVHEDQKGVPRVLFLLNPTEVDQLVQISVGNSIQTVRDLFEQSNWTCRRGLLELRVKAGTVRMLAVQ